MDFQIDKKKDKIKNEYCKNKNIIEKDCHSWYMEDTGMDVACPVGTSIRAVADGVLIYEEFGHTKWGTTDNVGIDTAFCALLKLDVPQTINGIDYTLVWYCHMSREDFNVPDGGPGRHVKQGEEIGKSGIGNSVPHLHFGILTNRQQAEGDYMPPAEVAAYMTKLIKLGKNK